MDKHVCLRIYIGKHTYISIFIYICIYLCSKRAIYDIYMTLQIYKSIRSPICILLCLRRVCLALPTRCASDAFPLSFSLPLFFTHFFPHSLSALYSLFTPLPRQLLPCTSRHFFPNAVLTATATRVIRCTCSPSLLLYHCPTQFLSLPSSSFRCSAPCWATLSSNCWLSCWQSRISCWQCSQWIFTYAPATHTHSNTHTHTTTTSQTHSKTHTATHTEQHQQTRSLTAKPRSLKVGNKLWAVAVAVTAGSAANVAAFC